MDSRIELADDPVSIHEFMLSRGRASTFNDGERRLMFEVLLDAVRIYCGSPILLGDHFNERVRGTLGAQARTEAFEWLKADDYSSVFTFASICAALDIDKDVLRAGLASWMERRNAGEEVSAIQRRHDTTRRTGVLTPPRYRPDHRRLV